MDVTVYIGIIITWDYVHRTVTLSMTSYVPQIGCNPREPRTGKTYGSIRVSSSEENNRPLGA